MNDLVTKNLVKKEPSTKGLTTASLLTRDSIIVDYGAPSTLARCAGQYWSENDRRSMPWLCLILLVAFLFVGPQFLLWLVGFLPADQLGNSGASKFAHLVVVATASLFALAAAALVVKMLARPRYIELGENGVALVWRYLLIKCKTRCLKWSDITTANIFQPADSIDTRLSRLQFGTVQKADALSIPLGQIDGDVRRQAVADAIAKYSVHAVEPEVFTALAPKHDLSFTEVWLDALLAAPQREKLLPLEPGAILDGRYRIKSCIGSGGQGTVYLAEDGESYADVVLKESILPVYADLVSRRQALESFHKEAFALDAVKHDNIVRFLGSFVADHRAYLVLEFIPGQTLAQAVQQDKPMEAARLLSLALQLCDILSHLHNQTPPMVHRDFTPDNLMLLDGEKITLIDFAVSVSSSAAGEWLDCEVAGKAAYMAPEQFKGRPQAQSDVYSLGATMYYLLTGETPEPLCELHPILANQQVDKALSDIIARATSLDCSSRYRSAAEVKAALQEVASRRQS